MKKFLSILLFAGILLSWQFFPTAYADDYTALRDRLTESCANNEEVDIAQFHLDEDSLDAAFVDVWYSGRLPWNVCSYSYSYQSDGEILTFSPTYYDTTQFDTARYEQAVAELLDEVIFDGMCQWEQVLAIHDYLIVNTAYDETLERNTNYDVLVNGSAVCSGYAMAYMDILTRLGIECRFVESQPMLHAWNLVKIDGSWYHVDVTHDDPTPDSYGYVSHDHFLKTDKEMESLGYHGWDSEITCTDTSFTEPFWANVSSTICLTPSARYMRVKNQWDYSIVSQLENTETALFHLPAQALQLEEDAYHYEHNGLSLWNGRLWFSDVDRVYSILPDGSDVQTVFLYDTGKNGKFIYSSFVDAGMLYLTLSNHQYDFSTQKIALTDSGYHTHSYTQTTLDSTCTEAGGILNICQCGLSYNLETTPAKGHTYDTYISQQATCQQEGEKTFLCSVCGDCYTEFFADPNAHSYASTVIKEPSFFKEGMKHLTCRLCGFSTYESIEKLSFQTQFGLTVWSTLCVLILLVCMPILVVNSHKRK